ncbi:hypothetical protein [Vibrio sonorensis]|uniref:hypothetical protein n=1 Tax=Vibrio sonorensis TaxID=1004316 RepID=UPI001586C338|nr:hypothetical protein [Vibrio sonorensis]
MNRSTVLRPAGITFDAMTQYGAFSNKNRDVQVTPAEAMTSTKQNTSQPHDRSVYQ